MNKVGGALGFISGLANAGLYMYSHNLETAFAYVLVAIWAGLYAAGSE